ncbi:hypothetical protein BT63DRAFT_278920 [Microthyrium microscopicum]|uniref:Uncharacterized protein n=1 Tax=Microthyrium microscopicum TaxID=703497 RepID=A0A6A6UAN5_9PEZI|nr:hypothetical protein BT63DRAFT_278920 [Microthyrium microscopicum]
MPFLARLGQSDERYQWAPIRDSNFGNSSHTSAFHTSRPKARLSRPPIFPEGEGITSPLSPPPAYSELRNFNRRQDFGPGVDAGISPGRPLSAVSALDETAQEQLTSNNIARLNNVRYGEVTRQAQVKSRISTVSQYPVLFNTDATSNDHPRRLSTRRRPISIASTSTTGIYLAVGNLPGSEPFDLQPPTQEILDRHAGRPAAPVASSTLNMPGGRREVYQTAQAVRVLARNTPNASTTSVNRLDRVSVVSTGSGQDQSLGRHRSVSTTSIPYTSPNRRPSIQPSNTWPSNGNRQSMSRLRDVSQPTTNELPPPPLPKDEGYIPRANRRRRGEIRCYSSTPQLSSQTTSAMQREGIIKEHSGVGQDKPPRSWFASLGASRNPQRRSRLPILQKISRQNLNDEKSPSNRRSQLLLACARLVGRFVPRVAEHKGPR